MEEVTKKERESLTEEVRLNKWLSEKGICSRREADRLTEQGRILVDGRKALMGQKVRDGQEIVLDGRKISGGQERLHTPAPVLLMLNKPRGIVCTTSDKDRAMNVVDFVGYPERVYPVGRLDKDSEGLLLLTNQGDLVNRMMRSVNAHEKEYLVTTNRPVTEEFLRAMRAGVPILDTVTRPCQAEKTGECSFRIVLTQGLNRQIRRMCEYFGYRVLTLKRVRIMSLHLGRLKTGEWRKVSEQEQKKLYELLKNSQK
ncbi:MAG: pseudouridine synthase [bacterium]|nr:pseudouridine synthase [bacterium]